MGHASWESVVTNWLHTDISTLFRYYNVVEIIKDCVSMGKYSLLWKLFKVLGYIIICVKITMSLKIIG